MESKRLSLNNSKEKTPRRAVPWSAREDRLIAEEVGKVGGKLGEGKWKAVAGTILEELGVSREWKQLRYRWCRHLDPTLLKTEFTREEELKVIEAQKRIGNKWTEISESLPGRSYWQIKTLWEKKLKFANSAALEKRTPHTPTQLQCLVSNVKPPLKRYLTEPNGASLSRKLAKRSVSDLQEPLFADHLTPYSRILVPKSSETRLRHLNLLNNILSIPVVDSDTESEPEVSAIRNMTPNRARVKGISADWMEDSNPNPLFSLSNNNNSRSTTYHSRKSSDDFLVDATLLTPRR